MASRNRLDGTICEDIALNARFLNNGIPQDPAALCSIQIYSCSVSDENLVTEITLPAPTPEDFDLSNEFIYGGLIQRCGDTSEDPQCGSDGTPMFTPGCFILNLNLCPDLFQSGLYFDVWNFVGSDCDPCSDITNVTDITNASPCDDESQIQSQCNKFFIGSGWYVDDGLRNIQLGFEPLDKRYQQPEKRYLEVGLTPLPLYDYDQSFAALIPSLSATITFVTACNEVLIDAEPMTIGLRQGSYRSNPYTVKYLLDSTRFLKGTYRYRVDVQLPDGQTRSSPYMTLAIR